MANYTILLIDYEPRSIERFRDPLVAAGYSVEIATDGISGMEAFHRLNPDMVLVEAMIPKKHGFEVCQELKRTPHGRRTPVIITTGVYKGRKYRTQALHIYGCDEYIEKPIAPAQLLEIVGKFLAPGTSAPIAEPVAPEPVPLQTGDVPNLRKNVDAIAKPGHSVVQDDREGEIMARLDALLSGGGGAHSLFEGPEKIAVVATVEKDLFSQMRAELDSELGATSTPLAFETAPNLEPILEPLVSDQKESPSVFEALPIPAPEIPIAVAPLATPVVMGEHADQLGNFDTKRHRKSKKSERSGKKRSPQVGQNAHGVEVAEIPEVAKIPEVTKIPEVAKIPEVTKIPEVANLPAPPQVVELALPRWTIAESELAATEARRGMPIWAWCAIAVVAVVGLYFVFPHGNSVPSRPAPSPQPPATIVESAPPIVSPPPAASAPIVDPAPPVASAPSKTPSGVSEPSRALPDGPTPALAAAKVPVPKKRSEPAPAPPVAPPTNTSPPKREPLTIEAAPPSAPNTSVAGVETVPDPEAVPAGTKIAPGALIPIDVADTMPVSLVHRAPAYSAAARQLRVFGTVIMNVLINDRGTVDQVVLVTGVPGADLNDAAMAAAKTWTYRPATKDGVPVKVWKSEQVAFQP